MATVTADAPRGRVLAIAGSDSGGGAGIQADIKTVMALGGYAMTAVTAVTAQDTHGIAAIHPLPPAFVARQMQVVLDDLGADAVKTGMLGDAATVAAVAGVLAARPVRLPLVVDPVLVATGGQRLLAADALVALKRRLLPLATLLTPNLPEAEALTGLAIADEAAMRRAADLLLTLGVPAVLLKGGHLPGAEATDLLATRAGILRLSSPRRATRDTHGTGCTLASAVAVGLAQGMALPDAVRRAHAYVQAALAAAPGFGGGHGPLGHAVIVDPRSGDAPAAGGADAAAGACPPP
jgi:hydroxymethylpyrimidine/phosphomethylpyrimidine kinase